MPRVPDYGAAPKVEPTRTPQRQVRAPQQRPYADAPQQRAVMRETPQLVTPKLITPQLNAPQAFNTPDFAGLPLEKTNLYEVPRVTARYDGAEDQGAMIKAKQLGALGQSVASAGAVALDIIGDIQERTNKLAAKDALSSVRNTQIFLTSDKEQGFSSVRGKAAVVRDKPLTADYLERFDQESQEAAASLKNDRQRQLFEERRQEMRAVFENQLVQHEATQYRDYTVSVEKGNIQSATELLARTAKDPTAVAAGLREIENSVRELGQLQGLSDGETLHNMRTAVSEAHMKVIEGAIAEDNSGFAMAYLEEHADEMLTHEAAQARKAISTEVDTSIGMTVANDAILNVAPGLTSTELGRASNIALDPGTVKQAFGALVQTESKGIHVGKDGKIIQGPDIKGTTDHATGVAQVMPETGPEAARLAGLKWDEKLFNDAGPEGKAYNLKLGQAYFEQQVRTFKGDIAKGFAAYNAGPKWVQAADERAKTARAQGKTGPEANWFWQLNHDKRSPENRAQTQAYVLDATKRMGAGPNEGVPAKPTLADVLAIVRADPRASSSPSRLKVAEAYAEKQWRERAAAEKEREEAVLAEAYKAIDANGGSYDALPASLRAQIPGDKIQTLRDVAERRNNPEKQVDNLEEYARLTAHPAVLAGMSDNQWVAMAHNFTPSTYRSLSDERGRLRNPKPSKDQDPGDLKVTVINNVLETRLANLGINAKPAAKDSKGQAHIGMINRFVRQQLTAAQYNAGRSFNEAETEAFVDGLFNKQRTFNMTGGIIGNGPRTVPMMGLEVRDLPASSVKAIRDSYKRRGITELTDDDILFTYWRDVSK